MSNTKASMDDVLKYVERFTEGNQKNCSQAMFYFLYKEILVNRMMLLEGDRHANKASLDHTEKVINDLNILLMQQLKA